MSSSYRIVYPCRLTDFRLLSRSNIYVCYNASFCRRASPILDDRIDRFRQDFLRDRRARGLPVYDERSYRLAGLHHDGDSLTLDVGPTTYAEYMAFRSDPDILDGISETSDQGAEFLPNVIGNVGVLLTKEGTAFAVLRSRNVSTYIGYLDLPGGHPEPVKVEATQQADTSGQLDQNMLVRDELFDAITREVIEDLGIGDLSLDDPLLYAVLLNLEDVMKPDMAFLITTSHTEAEVRNCFLDQDPRPMEVTDLISFDPVNVGAVLTKYRMTPIMEGAIEVLRQLGSSELKKQIEQARLR